MYELRTLLHTCFARGLSALTAESEASFADSAVVMTLTARTVLHMKRVMRTVER